MNLKVVYMTLLKMGNAHSVVNVVVTVCQ
jgi:hypothetical protein